MQSPITSWRRQRETRHLLGKIGTVRTWTRIHVGGTAFDSTTPYPVVLVDLEGAKTAYGELVDYDPDDLRTGRKVEAVLRRGKQTDDDTVLEYSIKYKPI